MSLLFLPKILLITNYHMWTSSGYYQDAEKVWKQGEMKLLFKKESVVYLSRSSFDGVPWMQEQILGCQEGKWKRRSKDSRFRQYLEEGGKNILAGRGGGVP